MIDGFAGEWNSPGEHFIKDDTKTPDIGASVGHSAQLEGCVVEQGAVVGMGATMLQRSRLGAGSMLAAGAVLGEGKSVPAGHMAAGVPATVRKPLDGSSESWVGTAAKHYQDRAVRYRANLRPSRS